MPSVDLEPGARRMPARPARPARRRLAWLLLALLLLLAAVLLWRHRFGEPEDFDDMESQFKYGSIGADHPLARAPLPYWIWKVLPELLPPAATMPAQVAPKDPAASLSAFGFVSEAQLPRPVGVHAGRPAFERPVGFSRRNVLGFDFVGMNCAACHVSTLRASAGAPREVVLGGTGNHVDMERYFLYMFAAFENKRFNGDDVMAAVDREAQRQHAELNWAERLVYRYVFVPAIPHVIKTLKVEDFDFIALHSPTRLPTFGPGRLDTWSLYKRQFVSPPEHDTTPGIVDIPAIWNQKARLGMRMHWDGNTDVLEERNIVSALALVGTRLRILDLPRVTRVTDWTLGLLPPRYADRLPAPAVPPSAADRAGHQQLLQRGDAVFRANCANCHAADGLRVGRVEPNAGLGADANRIRDFTPTLADALNRLGTREWKLRHFQPQNGYVNNLLDGIWLRAPYLHNGSVPTLRDLLRPPAERPRRWCRGDDSYDWVNVGYVAAPATAAADGGCGAGFVFDTATPGNASAGHFYGTDLDDADKRALLEFLKTL